MTEQTFRIQLSTEKILQLQDRLQTMEGFKYKYANRYLEARAIQARMEHNRHIYKTFVTANEDKIPAYIQNILHMHRYRVPRPEAQSPEIEDFLRQIFRYAEASSRLKAQIRLLESRPVITQAYSMEELTREFEAFNLSFSLQTEGFLACHIPEGLQARLTHFEDVPKNFSYSGDLKVPRFVTLPAITLYIPEQSDGCIEVHPTNKKDGFWTSYNPCTAHPHIMSDYTPCLGDFAAPIAETLESGDIPMIILIMLEYLQTINVGDSAGTQWIGMWDSSLRDFDSDGHSFYIDLDRETVHIDSEEDYYDGEEEHG